MYLKPVYTQIKIPNLEDVSTFKQLSSRILSTKDIRKQLINIFQLQDASISAALENYTPEKTDALDFLLDCKNFRAELYTILHYDDSYRTFNKICQYISSTYKPPQDTPVCILEDSKKFLYPSEFCAYFEGKESPYVVNHKDLSTIIQYRPDDNIHTKELYAIDAHQYIDITKQTLCTELYLLTMILKGSQATIHTDEDLSCKILSSTYLAHFLWPAGKSYDTIKAALDFHYPQKSLYDIFGVSTPDVLSYHFT